MSAYPSPDLAFSAAFTDVGYSRISRLNDQLLARNALTYAFEFNDPDASNLSLPPDPFLPPGAVATTELPFLWPNLLGTNGAVRSAFNAPERALATEMQLAWTNFARTSDPNGPGVTVWSPFSILVTGSTPSRRERSARARASPSTTKAASGSRSRSKALLPQSAP